MGLRSSRSKWYGASDTERLLVSVGGVKFYTCTWVILLMLNNIVILIPSTSIHILEFLPCSFIRSRKNGAAYPTKLRPNGLASELNTLNFYSQEVRTIISVA